MRIATPVLASIVALSATPLAAQQKPSDLTCAMALMVVHRTAPAEKKDALRQITAFYFGKLDAAGKLADFPALSSKEEKILEEKGIAPTTVAGQCAAAYNKALAPFAAAEPAQSKAPAGR